MASILQTEQDKDQEQAGQMTFGQQDSGPAQPGGQQPTQSPAPKGSGRFMNLQKYVQANKPQAEQMAGRIGGSIAEKAQQAQKSAQDIQSQFGQQAQQEQQRLGQTEQFLGQLGSAAGAQGILQSPEELQKFQQIRQGGLNLNPANLAQQQQQLQALGEQGKLAGSEAGRFQLLRQQFGSPSYSLGQRKLDQLLLQAVPGASQAMQQQINPALTGLQQTLSGAEQDIASQYGNIQSLAGQQQQALNQALTGGVSDIESQLEAAREAASTGRTEAMGQFGTNVATRNLSAEQLAALGPQLQSPYASLYNLNLADFMKPTDDQLGDISIGQVASPEQAQRYASLQQLGDLTGKYSGLTPDQAGYNKLPLDTERLYQELANQQTSFESQFKPQADVYQGLERARTGLPTDQAFQNILNQVTNQNYSNLDSQRAINYQPFMDSLINAGVDPGTAIQIMNNQYMHYDPKDMFERMRPGGFVQDVYNTVSGSAAAKQNALRQLAGQRGALNMLADYAPQSSFGEQPVTRDDTAQFQELLRRYSGQNVGALS
jgi:hypothetical protein